MGTENMSMKEVLETALLFLRRSMEDRVRFPYQSEQEYGWAVDYINEALARLLKSSIEGS